MSVRLRRGLVCCHSEKSGYCQDQCHMMEVRELVQVPGLQQGSPDRAGMYNMPVSIQGDIQGTKTENRGNQSLRQPSTYFRDKLAGISDIVKGNVCGLACISVSWCGICKHWLGRHCLCRFQLCIRQNWRVVGDSRWGFPLGAVTQWNPEAHLQPRESNWWSGDPAKCCTVLSLFFCYYIIILSDAGHSNKGRADVDPMEPQGNAFPLAIILWKGLFLLAGHLQLG